MQYKVERKEYKEIKEERDFFMVLSIVMTIMFCIAVNIK